MEKINYPELEQHKKIHEIFRKIVTDLIPAIKSGDHKAYSQAIALSWGWLYNHIAKTDKKYGIYAKENGYI